MNMRRGTLAPGTTGTHTHTLTTHTSAKSLITHSRLKFAVAGATAGAGSCEL